MHLQQLNLEAEESFPRTSAVDGVEAQGAAAAEAKVEKT